MKRRRQTLSLPASPLRSRAHLLFTIHLTGLGLTRSILPRNSKQSAIVTVQSLASTEPQVPVGATSGIAPVSDVRPAEATAAGPPTPARRDPATTEVAASLIGLAPRTQQGDIAAARRLLERASDSDAAEAWFALAETYEPQMLARWGVLGVKPDLEKARTLYQRAEARGAQGARERLLAIRQ